MAQLDLGKDLLLMHARMFDHRAAMNAENKVFVKEFETKRNNREYTRLKEVASIEDKLGHLLPECCELSTTRLDLLQEKINNAIAKSEEILNRKSCEEEIRQTRKDKRDQNWTEFVKEMDKATHDVERLHRERMQELKHQHKDKDMCRGSSPDSCEETYSGQRPFSERECLALARYLYSRRSDLKAFLDVHTFGQLLMYPWGFTRQDSFHSEKQRALLKKISQRISVATGSIYKYGPASSVLYETSGDSTDWVYGYLGVVHSYGIELRPRMQGRGTLLGFKHPASDIVPSAGELFIVVREMLRYLDREPNMKRSI
eukprot:gene6298-7020_t